MRQTKLNKLNIAITGCKDCYLGRCEENKRRQALGRKCGSQPKIVFVGQNPWSNPIVLRKGKTRYAFTGKAGEFLDECLKEHCLYDISYITNLVRCSKPYNDQLDKVEVKACLRHLRNELEIIQPRLIVALGSTSRKWLRGHYENFHKVTLGTTPCTVYSMAHPSYVLRGGMGTATYKDNFVKIQEYMEKIK